MIDKDPSKKVGEFEDLTTVEKYEISDTAYAKRTGMCPSEPDIHSLSLICDPKVMLG